MVMDPVDCRFYASLFTSIGPERWINNAQVTSRLAARWPFAPQFWTWPETENFDGRSLELGAPVDVLVDGAGSLVSTHICAEAIDGSPFLFVRHLTGSIPAWLVRRQGLWTRASWTADPWSVRECSGSLYECGGPDGHEGSHHTPIKPVQRCAGPHDEQPVFSALGEGLVFFLCQCGQFWAESRR